MKRVIQGKIYDTQTANLIVVLPCLHAKDNWKWNETTLYRTPMGRYFLVGKGEALSRWAQATPSGAIAGEGLEPISQADARAYAVDTGVSPDRFARLGFDPIGP